MSNMTCPAVLEPEEDGWYGISFPDLPGCFSFGENLIEAQQVAEEAAYGQVMSLRIITCVCIDVRIFTCCDIVG